MFDDEYIDFHVEEGADIVEAAVLVVEAMENLGLEAVMTLPDGTFFEIEKECSVEDIVNGYNAYMKRKKKKPQPVNSNKPLGKPKM